MDVTALPSNSTLALLSDLAAIREPLDVAWVRLPGILPHVHDFEIVCRQCGQVVLLRSYPMRGEAAWVTDEGRVDAFVAGQCPDCGTVTWGTILLLDW